MNTQTTVWLIVLFLLLAGCTPLDTATRPTPLPTVEPAQWQAGAVQQVSTIATDTYTTTAAGRVTSIAISPDGRTAAVGRDDASLTLWDAATGELLRTLPKHSGWVTGLAFSPDGALLASNSDRVVSVWQTDDGTRLDAFTVALVDVHWGRFDDRPRTFLAFAADGRTLAYSNQGGATGIRDVLTPRRERFASVYREDGPISITPDGSLLAAGDYNGTVKVWDTASGTLAHNLGEDTMLRWQRAAPQFSPDGTLLAIAHSQGERHNRQSLHNGYMVATRSTLPGRLSLHSVADGTVRFARQSPGMGSFLTVAFSPDGTLLAAGHDTGAITLWDAATGEHLQTVGTHDGAVLAVAFSQDGRVLLSGSDSGEIIRWHPADPATLAALPTAVSTITPTPTVTPTPTPTPDPRLDAAPPAPETRDPVEPLPPDALLLADGRELVALTTDGRELARLALPEAHQYPEITLSPDGRWLVYRDYTQHPIVLKLHTGQRWRVTDPALGDAVTRPSFSPDSRLLTYRVSDARRWQVRGIDLQQMTTRVLLEGSQDENREERIQRQVEAGIIRETALLDLSGTRYPSPDGTLMGVVRDDWGSHTPWSSLRVYDVRTDQWYPIVPFTDQFSIDAVSWSPDQTHLAYWWGNRMERFGVSSTDGTHDYALSFSNHHADYDWETIPRENHIDGVLDGAWLDDETVLVLVAFHQHNRAELHTIPISDFSPMEFTVLRTLDDGREISQYHLNAEEPAQHFATTDAQHLATFTTDARILHVPR